MEFSKVITQRYSCRNYLNKTIPDELIYELINIAKNAPSAVNKQPWQIIAVKSKPNLQILQKCYNRACFKTAPLVLVICSNTSEAWVRQYYNKNHADIDTAIIADHITLAATNAGLTTCWVCNFDYNELVSSLKLPNNIKPVVMMPLGYPATENTEPKIRKTIHDIIKMI